MPVPPRFVVITTVLLALAAPSLAAAPRAANGRLDLSQWEFSEPAALDGFWEFYWNQLLYPADFTGRAEPGAGDGGPEPLYIALPKLWRGLPTPSGSLPGRGVATYRLLVTMPGPAPGRLAVAVPGTLYAYRLFADGTLVAAAGDVSADLEAVRPRYAPAIAPLAGGGAEGYGGRTVELILQVANHEFRSGGVLKSLKLGHVEQLVREQRVRHMLQVGLLAAMLMMSLYHGVFFVWHRNRTTMYFAALTFVLALRTAVVGEMPLLTLFPGFPWGAHLRVEYTTNFLALFFFMQFLRSLFPLDVAGWIVRVVSAVAIAGSVAAATLPIPFVSSLVPPYSVFIGVVVLYAMGILVAAFRRRREASEFFLAGGLVFLVCVVLALLHYNQLWVKFDWLPVGTGVLLISQSLMQARRYALTFRREVALSAMNARLLDESQRLLGERQRLHHLLASQDVKLRREIAEMLHGRTQARLHAAWYHTGRAGQLLRSDPEEAQRLLATVQDYIDQVREEDIREASHRLHPAALGAGLVAALDSLLQPLRGHYDVELTVDPACEELDEPGRYPFMHDVRLALYRIAEEALNNIRRHAHAKKVSVVLCCQLGKVPPSGIATGASPAEPEPPGEMDGAATPHGRGAPAGCTAPVESTAPDGFATPDGSAALGGVPTPEGPAAPGESAAPAPGEPAAPGGPAAPAPEEPAAPGGPAAPAPAGSGALIGHGGAYWLELTIIDDGVGVDIDPADYGLGLRLIAARVADLGGEWEIGRGPEGGTRLRVVVPLPTGPGGPLGQPSRPGDPFHARA